MNFLILKIFFILGVLGECYEVIWERHIEDERRLHLRDAPAQHDACPHGECPRPPPPHQAEPGADVPIGWPQDQSESSFSGTWHRLLSLA